MEGDNKGNSKSDLNTKMNFEGIKDKHPTFHQESDEYAGRDVEVTFLLDYEGDLNGKEFSDTFKEGQDFEFVKYKLSQVLGINQDLIELYHKGQVIIPVYSICDIELGENEKIIIKIKA